MAEKLNFKYQKKTQKKLKADSLKWYKDLVGTTNPTASNFETYREDGGGMKGKIAPGVLQHFTYLPKYRNDRKVLPYYDAFPLSLTMDMVMEETPIST